MSSILASLRKKKNLIYLVDFTLLYIYCESIVIQAADLNTYNSLVVELDNFSITNLFLFFFFILFWMQLAAERSINDS